MYEYKTICTNCLAEHEYILEPEEHTRCENCNENACPDCEEQFKECPKCNFKYCASCFRFEVCDVCSMDEEDEDIEVGERDVYEE